MSIWRWSVGLILLAVSLAGAAHAQDAVHRVLFLYPDTSSYPATNIIAEAARQRLNERSSRKVEVYAEFLDQTRFPGPQHERRVAEYLADKYAGTRIDAVIALGPSPLRFILDHRGRIAPGAVITFCGVSDYSVQQGAIPAGVSGILIEVDLARTLELAARLQPDARQLVVVAGASTFDRRLEQIARRQLASVSARYETRYLVGLPMSELVRELGRLSSDTIVLLTTIYADGAGKSLTPVDTVSVVSRAATAPVYAPYEVYVGLGVVGGFVDSFHVQGTAVADLTLNLLAGGSAGPPVPTGASVDVVDWRELKRHGLNQANLSPGTDVRFKQPSLWAQHRETVLWTLAAFTVQSAVVLALLVQVRRRRRAEQSLVQSEERMAFAAASVNVGLWQYDRTRDSIWVTDHCREMFGIPAGQPLELDAFLQPVHPDDRAAARHWLRLLRESRIPVVRELRILQKDDKVAWYMACGQARFDEQGQPMIISGIFSDVTPRKQAELEADSQREALTHLTRVSLLGELSGAIAHEIYQPLTAILANAQAARRMLGKRPPDLAEVGEALDDIIREDSRADEVIRRLRGMLRKGEGKSESVVLNDLVPPVLHLVHRELASRGIGVKLQLGEDLPPIAGDAIQLQQVLINLLMNAVDAVSSVGVPQRTIIVATRSAGTGQVELVVADRGPGLDEAQRARVFEPFYTTKKHGLGLGLAICASIARSHGGELRLDSNDGGGVSAQLILPALSVAMAAL